ncbi:MAG: TetR/AcrR family transcriptional regulator [Rhodobacteraceae bacterium]|nr:TetR/AcrR family transcriptional regulator [Paracoccaceae bacterium]
MPSDTKSAILAAAEQAVRRKGYDGFSYADLSKKVGIRKASIHYHFPTKADLSVALMQRYMTEFSSACTEIEKQNTTGAARLSGLINYYRLAIDDGRCLCLCVSFSGSRDSLSEALVTQIRRFREETLQWIERAFDLGRADGSVLNVAGPAQEAAATLALLEGAQLMARAQIDPSRFDNATVLLHHRLRVAA